MVEAPCVETILVEVERMAVVGGLRCLLVDLTEEALALVESTEETVVSAASAVDVVTSAVVDTSATLDDEAGLRRSTVGVSVRPG